MRINDRINTGETPGSGSPSQIQANEKLSSKINGRNVRNIRGQQGKIDTKVDAFFQGIIKPHSHS